MYFGKKFENSFREIYEKECGLKAGEWRGLGGDRDIL